MSLSLASATCTHPYTVEDELIIGIMSRVPGVIRIRTTTRLATSYLPHG